MLQLRRIEIKNFACFDNLVIEPSTDADRPLTVIRAENGSGKTTLLRAIRWGMYSERGLPGVATRFSLHPAAWRPDDDGITTQVVIEFETDGSTRHNREGGATAVYQLSRSVTTIGQPAATDDAPDFRRINDTAQLMIKAADGTWSPYSGAVETVIEELLPWGLRDFFVMDADEATDFVGGSENKPMSRQAVTEKTTSAVQSLLGIDVFKKAFQRVTAIGEQFGAAATKAIGDADLDAMQEELDQLRASRAKLHATVEAERVQFADIRDRVERQKDDLENELKGVGAAAELEKRLAENRKLETRAKKDRAKTVALLAGSLEATDLLASLASGKIREAYGYLQPLYDEGRIPQKHLSFVRELLESGTCVCGEDLANDGSHRRHVEDRVAESAGQEERANYLAQLHDAARGLVAAAARDGSSWAEHRHALTEQLTRIDDELSEIGADRRDIDAKLDSIDQEKIQVLRDEIAALETQYDTLNRNLTLHTNELPPLVSRIDSLEKKINQRQRSERAAADKRAAQGIAELAADVLDGAYRTIQTEQVQELSERMNRLFAQMAANVSDDDFEEVQKNKATLRMIAEVGIRTVPSETERFEIFALNSRRRAMPPIEINGASRRVLALAFVLALCIESRTEATLIADSLLNFMSGAVRRNTLKATTENSSQPILLLTGADLEGQSEIETVENKAGVTYTLTGQWDAVDAGGGGDVVNWTTHEPVAVLCSCGPRQWCSVCERVGQAQSAGWTRRD